MKKLMITMLAASAVSAAAWAENEAGFSSEDFNGTAPVFTAAPWEYSAVSVGDGELTIKTGGNTSEGKFLELNAASKKLSLAPNADGSAYEVASEVYFDSYVKFDAASDTIPEVGTNDKLALFVLDNTDYLTEGTTVTPSTALYVLGGFWNGNAIEKRLYRLDTDVSTLTDFKRVSIKMYKNVLKSGSVPGFVVKVGTTIAQVNGAFPIAADGSLNFADNSAFTATYLGAEIDGAVAATRYSNLSHQLILGLKATEGTEKLNAVDFMGKGGIDDLAFGTTDLGFGADAQLFTIDLPANVLSVKYGEDTYTSAFDITATGEKVKMIITLANGYYYNNENPAEIEVDLTAGKKLSDLIKADDLVLGVAKVGSTVYAREAFLEGDFVTAGVSENMQLLSDLDLGTGGITFVGDVQLDLNGKTIGNNGGIEVVYAMNGAEVTIVGNGIVNGRVAAAEGSKISIPVTSTAKFLATANDAAALAGMLTGKDNAKNYAFVEEGDYLVLQVTDKPVVSTITYDLGGATWAQDYTAPANYTEGTGVDLPVATNLVKDGFEFGGWYANADFTGDAITAIGTDAKGNKTFYAKWTEVQEDVEIAPGESDSVDAADQDAADAIAAKVVVTVPADVKTGLAGVEGGEAAYKALFEAKAVYNDQTKKYDITLALKEEVVTEVQEVVDAAATAVATALSDSTKNSVEVATKPGLFYGLVKQTSLDGMGAAKPGSWTMGTGAPLTFTLDKSGNCGFFKMVCSPTK